jgi:hypothetical protein
MATPPKPVAQTAYSVVFAVVVFAVVVVVVGATTWIVQPASTSASTATANHLWCAIATTLLDHLQP